MKKIEFEYNNAGYLTPESYNRWYLGQTAAVGHRCALIMAGGHSSRMGADKPTVTINGETMLSRAIAFWRSASFIDRVLVAIGPDGHLAELLPDDVVAIPDLISDRGPMGGLHAAFALTDAEILWVSGVDMPFLTPESILPEPAGDAAVYRNQGRSEPLYGVYRRSVFPVAEALLSRNVGKMQALLQQVDTTFVETNDTIRQAFRNVNTPEELLLARMGTPPLIPVVAWSGTGKTTALEGIIPALLHRGIRVCAIKHDAHTFEVDKPGKDTYRLSAAGATATAIMNPQKWAVMGSGECDLEELKAKLPPCDLILAEGFKYTRRPRLEIHRRATGRSLLSQPEDLIAVLTDEPLDISAPQLGLEDYEACADLLCRLLKAGNRCKNE